VRTRRQIVWHVQLDLYRQKLVQRIVFRARQESINIRKEKKSVQIVKLDVQQTLLETIKAIVCCVPLVKRLHDLAVQSVKIVVLAGMVLIVKNVKPGSIVSLLWTIQQAVPRV
jgi:hypothetical protein